MGERGRKQLRSLASASGKTLGRKTCELNVLLKASSPLSYAHPIPP